MTDDMLLFTRLDGAPVSPRGLTKEWAASRSASGCRFPFTLYGTPMPAFGRRRR